MKLVGVALGALIGAAVGFGLVIAIEARVETNSNQTIGLPIACLMIVGAALIGGILISNLVRR